MVTSRSEQVSNLWVVVELATLVHMDIFIRAGISRGVLREEVSKPLHRRGLGSPGITILHTCEVISDQDLASFTIETFIILPSGSSIIGCLAGEGKING